MFSKSHIRVRSRLTLCFGMRSVNFWHNPNNVKQLYTERLKNRQKSLRANIKPTDKPYFLLYTLGHKKALTLFSEKFHNIA